MAKRLIAESPISGKTNIWEIASGGFRFYGNSFKPTESGTIYSIKVNLKRGAGTTGTFYIRLYTHTGTYGSTGKPFTYLNKTSDGKNVVDLTTSLADYEIVFSGLNRIVLIKDTPYCFEIFNNNNSIYASYNSNNASYSGNASHQLDGSTSWNYTTHDVVFEIYRDDTVTVESIDINTAKFSDDVNVVITGTNFVGAKSVKFGTTEATFVVNSSTQITAKMPNNLVSGSHHITVTGLYDDVSAETASDLFTTTYPDGISVFIND